MYSKRRVPRPAIITFMPRMQSAAPENRIRLHCAATRRLSIGIKTMNQDGRCEPSAVIF